MEKITKRKDGRYEIRVYLGTEGKKPQYKSVYGKTKKEVKEKALQLKMSKANGMEILSRDNKSFEFWCNSFLDNLEERCIRDDKTDYYNQQKARASVWIKHLGKEDITKIRMTDIDKVLNSIARSNPRYPKKKTAAKTLKEYRLVALRVFDFCIANRVIVFNPVTATIPPKAPPPKEIVVLSNEEIKYIRETPHECQMFCMLAIFAGLRQGEILALDWKSVDFQKNTITINKSANQRQHGKIKTTKTEAGIRTIPISSVLVDYLQEHRTNTLLVFNRNGMPFTKGMYEKSLQNYCKVISEKYHVNFHTSSHPLRHTFCTLLFESGVDLETASYLMGHKDKSTTIKIYAHLRELNKQRNVNKLNEYIANM